MQYNVGDILVAPWGRVFLVATKQYYDYNLVYTDKTTGEAVSIRYSEADLNTLCASDGCYKYKHFSTNK